jgi:hypothetical protein
MKFLWLLRKPSFALPLILRLIFKLGNSFESEEMVNATCCLKNFSACAEV